MIKNKYFDQRKNCPLCNSKKVDLIFSKKFNEIKTNKFFLKHLNKKFPMSILNENFYNLSECKICKIIFQNNILNKKYNGKFYDEYIDHESIKVEKNYYKLINNIHKKEVKLINKIYQNKKIDILEFGAGLGSWITAMKESGYNNIYAIEISKKRKAYLKKKKIKCFESVQNIKKKFDLIYSDQTFEHLAEPGKIIDLLINLIKKNGYIFFKIPPGRFLKSKLNDDYLAQKDEATPLEHINIFTRESVNYIERKYKLKKIKIFRFFKIYELNFLRFLLSDLYQSFVGKKLLFKK